MESPRHGDASSRVTVEKVGNPNFERDGQQEEKKQWFPFGFGNMFGGQNTFKGVGPHKEKFIEVACN